MQLLFLSEAFLGCFVVMLALDIFTYALYIAGSSLLASNRQQHHTYNNQHKVEGLVFEILFAHKECAGKEGYNNR